MKTRILPGLLATIGLFIFAACSTPTGSRSDDSGFEEGADGEFVDETDATAFGGNSMAERASIIRPF
ncbi:MAG TPA: hypothetical protein VMN36_17385 [Verrucomicrobiales bacterium]|nr:hypothetical protein [Verrucomicrobiales bacterium]